MKITTTPAATVCTDVAAVLRPRPAVRTMAPSGQLGAGEKSVFATVIRTDDNSQGSHGWSLPA
jgi:hypothetical protein